MNADVKDVLLRLAAEYDLQANLCEQTARGLDFDQDREGVIEYRARGSALLHVAFDLQAIAEAKIDMPPPVESTRRRMISEPSRGSETGGSEQVIVGENADGPSDGSVMQAPAPAAGDSGTPNKFAPGDHVRWAPNRDGDFMYGVLGRRRGPYELHALSWEIGSAVVAEDQLEHVPACQQQEEAEGRTIYVVVGSNCSDDPVEAYTTLEDAVINALSTKPWSVECPWEEVEHYPLHLRTWRSYGNVIGVRTLQLHGMDHWSYEHELGALRMSLVTWLRADDELRQPHALPKCVEPVFDAVSIMLDLPCSDEDGVPEELHSRGHRLAEPKMDLVNGVYIVEWGPSDRREKNVLEGLQDALSHYVERVEAWKANVR